MRKPKLNALPTINLPEKSHEKKVTTPRRVLVRVPPPPVADPTPVVPLVEEENDVEVVVFESYEDFKSQCSKWKLSNWKIVFTGEQCFLTYELEDSKFSIPKLEIIISSSLEFTVRVYGWYLPDDHNVYQKHNRSIRKILLTDFCLDILKLEFCKGVSSATAPKSTLHAIPLKYDKEVQVPSEIHYRSNVCEVLVAGNREICRICNSSEKKKDVKDKSNLTPASKFAPLSKTNPQKVILALQQERALTKKLTIDIEHLKNEMESKGIAVSSGMADDINAIMKNQSEDSSPFMKLFWREQKKLSSQGNYVYHPMMIRFCLSLASKSAKAYDELRDSKVSKNL